ncbi:hypothetical protein Tco_0999797 [Tanacetum coccineum]
MVNKTPTDMIELFDLLTQLVRNLYLSPTPLSVAIKKEKSAQAETSKCVKSKSPFEDCDNEEDQPSTPGNKKVALAQREP